MFGCALALERNPQAAAAIAERELADHRPAHHGEPPIEVAGVPIRLNGLAAPESDGSGGRSATAAMRRLVDGRNVRCELTGERTYDRCVGICYVDGEDIAAELVRQGVARDCPRYSGGRYAEAERRAAAEGATIGRTYRLPAYCR